ncbi:MAG: lysophospholipid acyltransferase family protein [Candidatus Omnitrophota bacterium]|nr:lysophospholipid acyltransferase family protein [Candidatus Omnitrophota bacterium]MDZ4241645.1 lysophospholipid acyltransferase family protein [Candidatus Omnitrophota bacterium]
MTFKDRIKIFNRGLARNALYVSSWLINRLPYPLFKAIMHFFITVGFLFTVRQKRIARESLRIAFGKEKSPAEINRIVRICFENFGRGMVELIYYMSHPAMIRANVQIDGKENLEAALRQGRGVVVVSAHFGNFPLMLLRLVQEGYKTSAIIRPARDQEIEKYFLQERDRLGLNTIYSHPRKECVDNSIRALRNNELVFIPLDQNFGSGAGVFVDFFGQQAATATGPVVFARRTGAALVPMFIVREGEDRHRIIIEPAMPLEEKADDEAMLVANVAKITKIIETYVRRYPHEWGWMHRRWKCQPAVQNAAAA